MYYSSTTPYYKRTALYYKVLLRQKRRQNDVHPVLLSTTKYYSSTASYYKVLLRTTKYYSSTTPYYKVLLCTTKYYFDRNDVRTTSIQYYSVLKNKVLLQYCFVLQSTTPYYKVLLHVLLLTTKYYSVLQSTTSTETTSEQRPSSTTKYYKVLLQYYKVLPRTTKYYSSTTLYYNVLLQYYSVLQTYYKVLLRTTEYYSSTTKYSSTTSTETTSERRPSSTTPYYKVLLQYYKVLPRTTKYYSSTTLYYKVLLQYYSVLQTYYKVLLRTTEYYSSTTPYYKVVQKLPKRAFRARLPQLFKEQASKTSISCETSSTFQRTSFQNEYFVRGFLNFSRNKLPKRAFRARLPQLVKEQASKTSISCEASLTFQRTSFQNEHFVRGFLNFSKNELPKRAFRARLPQLFKEQASKTSISCETSFKFHTFNSKIDDFVRVFLIKPFLQSSKSMTFAKLPPLFKTITKSCACHDICSSVTFACHCHCDSCKQHLRHVTKCCACHDIAKGHITKCCACHEKTTRLH